MRAICLAALLVGCSVDAVVIRDTIDEATFEAQFSYQPRDRVLFTAADPDRGVCAGLLLGRGIGDGIPGQLLELPDDWALELAYRSKSVADCHTSTPQLHRVEVAYAGSGAVTWAVPDPELPPPVIDVDVSLQFDAWPQRVELFAQDVVVEAPGTP